MILLAVYLLSKLVCTHISKKVAAPTQVEVLVQHTTRMVTIESNEVGDMDYERNDWDER